MFTVAPVRIVSHIHELLHMITFAGTDLFEAKVLDLVLPSKNVLDRSPAGPDSHFSRLDNDTVGL